MLNLENKIPPPLIASFCAIAMWMMANYTPNLDVSFGLRVIAVLLGSPVALLGVLGFVLYIKQFQILPEERALQALFGADFTYYRSQVGRWL